MGPCRNTTRTLSEEHFGRLEQAGVEELGLRERLVERHQLDLRAPQRDHPAELARAGSIDGGDAEARAEDPVVGDRRAAALDVAEDRHPRLVARAPLDLALELDGDPAEALVAEGVRGAAEFGL